MRGFCGYLCCKYLLSPVARPFLLWMSSDDQKFLMLMESNSAIVSFMTVLEELYLCYLEEFLPSFLLLPFICISCILLPLELYSMYSCFKRTYNYVVQHHLLKTVISLLLCRAAFVINPMYTCIHLGLRLNFLFCSIEEFVLTLHC